MFGLLLALAIPMWTNARYEGYLDGYVSLGYGGGQLDWNIADTDGSPNVLSELTYKADEVVVLEAGGRLFIESGPLDRVFGELRGWVGLIEDGTNEDRDWNSDNRTDLYSLSEAELYGHNLRKYSLGIGYQFSLNERFILSPVVGYAHSEQNTKARNGKQVVSEPPASGALGPFDGLDSSYDTVWSGPWIGGELMATIARMHDLTIRFEYHAPDYEATANWNLRTDLAQPVSFKHHIDNPSGYLIQVRYRYPLYESFAVMLGGEYEVMEGEDGTDTIFLSDDTSIASPLNEVNWEFWQVSIGANYRF